MEGWVVHLLKGTIAAQSEGRGGRGGLAQNHEDWLHSNGSVGNVGCGKADWDREVLALIDFRQDGAVGNRVGRKSADLDVAFIFGMAVLHDTTGNRTHAAEILGISREGLRTKMQKLGLSPSVDE